MKFTPIIEYVHDQLDFQSNIHWITTQRDWVGFNSGKDHRVFLKPSFILKGTKLRRINNLVKFYNSKKRKYLMVNSSTNVYLDKNGNQIEEYYSVIVPDPNDSDIHNFMFVGIVVGFRNGYVQVRDADDNVFEIEPERLEIENSNEDDD